MAQSMTGDSLNMFLLNASPPDGIDESQWTTWLSTEFISALMKSHAINRAAVYREVGFAMISNPNHPLRYVILLHTDFRHLQESGKYKKAFERTDATRYLPSASVETRNYRLIQDYNPNGVSNTPGRNILSVEMNPEDKADFEDWYRKELLPKIGTLKGYIRSKRYQLADATDEVTSPYLALHEIQDLSKAFVSQQAHEEASTPRMERHIEASEKRKTDKGGGFIRRGWELVHHEGYKTNLLLQHSQATGWKVNHDVVVTSFFSRLRRVLVGIVSLRCKENSIDKFEPVFL